MQLTRRGFLGALIGAAAGVAAAKVLPFAGEKPLLKGELGVIKDFVIVTDKPFNADPTGLTDSTQAFNDAIHAAREVRIPAGTYRVSGVIVDRNVTIKGAGADKTTLVCFGGKPGLHVKGDPDDPGMVYVAGLNLVGVEAGDGMLVQRKAHVDACRVQGFRDGVRIEAPTDKSAVYFATITNTCANDNERDGFSFGEGAVGNASIGCSAYFNGRYGFYVTPSKRTHGNSIYGAYAT